MTCDMSLLHAFYVLTYASLATSTLIFVLSMLSFGAASWWTDPALSGLTILYHIVILILHGRDESRAKQRDGKFHGIPPLDYRYPTSKIASVVLAYILACAWVVPIAFIPAINFDPYIVFNLFAATIQSVKAELAFVVLECVMMLALAAISTRMRVVSNRRAKANQPVKHRHFIPDPRAEHTLSRLLRAFKYLTHISFALSSVVLVLSGLNHGYASLFMNLPISASTIAYHAVIFILHRYDSPSRDNALDGIPPQYYIRPTSKIASLVFAYILACLWVIPIPLIVLLGGLWGENYLLETSNIFSGSAHSVQAELFFGVVELGVIWAIAIISTRMRVISDRCINKPLPPLSTIPPTPQAGRMMTSLLRAVHIMTYVSITFSTLIFILSMLDLGYASFWLSPAITTLTVIYHIVILVLQRTDSQSRTGSSAQPGIYPTAKPGSLACAYLLAWSWFAVALVLGMGGALWDQYITHPKPRAASRVTVFLQLIFTIIECLLMFAIAAVCSRMNVVLKRWAKNRTIDSLERTYSEATIAMDSIKPSPDSQLKS